jgi:hypothetical protein
MAARRFQFSLRQLLLALVLLSASLAVFVRNQSGPDDGSIINLPVCAALLGGAYGSFVNRIVRGVFLGLLAFAAFYVYAWFTVFCVRY